MAVGEFTHIAPDAFRGICFPRMDGCIRRDVSKQVTDATPTLP